MDIEGRDLGSYVAEARDLVAKTIELPPGYSVAWSGQYEYLLRAQQKLAVVVPLTLAIIVLLLYMNFRNLVEVLIIMGTLPLAMIGGIWLMYLLGFNFSVAVGVGFLALAGVAVELGVLMLVYLNQSWRAVCADAATRQQAVSQEQLIRAVMDGASLRVRPIMMTSASIIVGLIPIMLSDGTGSEVMQRIAGPMIGGMISTLILSLLLIPVVYLLWQRSRLTHINKALSGPADVLNTQQRPLTGGV